MANLLTTWLVRFGAGWQQNGILLEEVEAGSSSAVSVNIDAERFVGRVTHWQPRLFEIQLNAIDSGDVVALESLDLDSVDEIEATLRRILGSIPDLRL